MHAHLQPLVTLGVARADQVCGVCLYVGRRKGEARARRRVSESPAPCGRPSGQGWTWGNRAAPRAPSPRDSGTLPHLPFPRPRFLRPPLFTCLAFFLVCAVFHGQLSATLYSRSPPLIHPYPPPSSPPHAPTPTPPPPPIHPHPSHHSTRPCPHCSLRGPRSTAEGPCGRGGGGEKKKAGVEAAECMAP